MSDNVNHPAHYGGEDNPYEVIKVAEAWGFDKNAYLFNVLKYIARPAKGHTLEDLKKARWYLDRLIGKLEGETLPRNGADRGPTFVTTSAPAATYEFPRPSMQQSCQGCMGTSGNHSCKYKDASN